nr:PCRF domain-containing protein [Calditrichia bacterium]
MQLLDKLQQIEEKFTRISTDMADPDIAGDPEKYTRLAKDYADLEDVVKKSREYRQVLERIEESKSMLHDDDEEMRELAREELESLEPQVERLEKEIQRLLVPPDPMDQKNIIMEIRAGSGGDEAGIFAGDLQRMYARYCEYNRWTMEMISANPAERGGFKEIVLAINGKGAFGRLKYESGVHRVQRVPDTESQGRV